MRMTLDIARHIGTPLPDTTKANGRQMTDYEYTPNYADSGDYTYAPRTATRHVAPIYEAEGVLTYSALVATVWRLQNELHAIEAQVVEMREQMEKWTADS